MIRSYNRSALFSTANCRIETGRNGAMTTKRPQSQLPCIDSMSKDQKRSYIKFPPITTAKCSTDEDGSCNKDSSSVQNLPHDLLVTANDPTGVVTKIRSQQSNRRNQRSISMPITNGE
eukprot:scaffold135404_cov30-Cyclotella_meneghiniana.AAC.3